MVFVRKTATTYKQVGWILMMLAYFCLSACSTQSGQVPEPVAYQDLKSDSCLAHPENGYHILFPRQLDQASEYPLLIVLDAHGDGRMAVQKFQLAVQYFPCLVAGSDLIRNNFSGFENAIMQLLDDLIKKYPVDRKHIVVSGFSGGARMAYQFALRYPVSGVLMCGAGPSGERPSCPVYTISGMGDFNFAEQYVRPDLASLSDDHYTSDYFHGIHEWPQPLQLSDALQVLYKDLSSTNKTRQLRSQELLEVADSLALAGDALMAWKAIEKSTKMAVSQSVRNQVHKRGNEMLSSSGLQEAVRTLEQDLKEEMSLQQEYPRLLFTQDEVWWQSELSELKRNLSETVVGLKRDHYLRVKGYIGILLYSVINRMIHNDPGNSRLPVILNIYAYAEPENPDVYFFRALDAYHQGDQESCIHSIRRSLELGFSDRRRLGAEFPESILQSVPL